MPQPQSRLSRFFRWMLRHRIATLAFCLALTGVLAGFASTVRTDPSVEAMFPVWDDQRVVYDRYKSDENFPYDDARAIVIAEAPGIFGAEALGRVRDLEDALAALPHVRYVEGPFSVNDIRADADKETVYVERLLPRTGLAGDPEMLRERVAIARTDPLFSWRIASPERDLVSISVVLETEAARHPKERMEFYRAAHEVLDAHEGGFERLTLTGIPSIRARYVDLVNSDMGLLLPLALLVILTILAITYRSPRVILAAGVTIAACVLWTVGFMGILYIPMGILTSFAPIIVMIISISDTVHIATDLDEHMQRGLTRREALVHAMASSAGPCLLTEITIACGFLSLAFVNITAILEFGCVTAAGMMFAWLANMTVLPLILSLSERTAARFAALAGLPWLARMVGGRPVPAPDAATAAMAADGAPLPPTSRGLFLNVFRRFLGGIEGLVVRRPRRVVLVALGFLALMIGLGSQIQVRHFVFDDLHHDSDFWKDLRYAEEAIGGLVPVAIFLEPQEGSAAAGSEAPALEPAALRFLAQAEARLEAIDDIENAVSPATFISKAHRAFAGDEIWREDGGLPRSRSLARQEVMLVDDQKMFRDVLSFDRRSGVALGYMPDRPSDEVRGLVDDLEVWAADNAPEGYDVHVTGILAIADRINEILLDGLLLSFAAAALVTFFVFMLVLRSARLAVIGLIPNLTPIAVMIGVMAVLGIDLKPSTVLLFAMVLTIADDDTIQYLARFRRHYAALAAERAASGEAPPPGDNLHLRAALDILRESGLPMFVTATTVSTGFMLLALSEFEGTANIGIITAVTLFAAVFADCFLAPIIIGWWRPPIAPAGKA